jgi:hypothetical protein
MSADEEKLDRPSDIWHWYLTLIFDADILHLW